MIRFMSYIKLFFHRKLMAIEQVNDNVLIYELFLPHNSAKDVPDVGQETS